MVFKALLDHLWGTVCVCLCCFSVFVCLLMRGGDMFKSLPIRVVFKALLEHLLGHLLCLFVFV